MNSFGLKKPSWSASITLNNRLLINPGKGKKRLNAKDIIPSLGLGVYMDNSRQISDKYKINIDGFFIWCSLMNDFKTK